MIRLRLSAQSDLSTDDEHLSVLGKGDRRRTVLLDDPQLVATLRRFLERTGYRHGLVAACVPQPECG